MMLNKIQKNFYSRLTPIFIGLSILILLFFLPENLFVSNISQCLHKQLFGFDCPGCGLTRAIYYLIHLEYRRALNFNVTVVFVLPLMIGETLYRLCPIELIKKARYFLYLTFSFSLLVLYCIRIYHH